MKSLSEKLKTRLKKNRPTATISIRLPADLIPDLEEIAPLRGYGSFEALVRSYIGEGLRRDEARFSTPGFNLATEALREHGIREEVINEVVAATMRKTA